ncbi:hypothetical protein [Undibacterium pigrum]|uniref:CheW-like domain-containing protein n=1 Tax=Undibacterium pigrum TaxID=401470 RepID=A0A318IU09_9BURK|nr:hypothetical protein [Undibacterium pigrum]PXX38684.1 hypothetical protein DFR42_11150 [Undibacterium pigrum]
MGAMMPGMRTEVRNRLLLRIDDMQLMLPQGDICAVESVADIQSQDAVAPAVGRIAYLGQCWPVLSLNGELQTLGSIPSARRACVMLATGEGFLGLLCDDVRVLNQQSGADYALPVAMRTANTPIQAVMPFENGLACISDTRYLLQYAGFAQLTSAHQEIQHA